jgi:hypothetical protein
MQANRYSLWRLSLAAALLAAMLGLGCMQAPAPATALPQAAVKADLPALDSLGIRYWLEVRTEPRPLRIHHLKIDLSDPRVEVAAVLADDPDGPDGPATAALTPPEVLAARARAVAFINANPWQAVPDVVGNRTTDWREGLPVQSLGLAAAAGQVRSPDLDGHCAFWIDTDARPHVGAPPPGAKVREAVAGFTRLLEDGRPVDTAAAPIHPRTALGLDASGRWLYLVVVDGRQPGYSEGLSTGELAACMKSLGAWQAVNLDGGGSSIMLARDAAAGWRTLNDPSTKVNGRSVPRPIPVGLAVRAKEK